MKILKLLPMVLLMIAATSCVSIKVTTDYDRKTNFNDYKTFAFYKKGIESVDISDLDKRRILRAIERELEAKGMTKSQNPDVLVNIFTKAKEKVNVYQNNWGWGGFGGWGWGGFGWGGFGPWGWGGFGPWGWGAGFDNNTVSTSTEGTLFIDVIDAEKKELAWQGMGVGYLKSSKDIDKKEARINEFVSEIMTAYPPSAEK